MNGPFTHHCIHVLFFRLFLIQRKGVWRVFRHTTSPLLPPDWAAGNWLGLGLGLGGWVWVRGRIRIRVNVRVRIKIKFMGLEFRVSVRV